MNPFHILGTTEDITQSELYQVYCNLRAEYASKRFCVGEEGQIACEKLDEIEQAYKEASDILASRFHIENVSDCLLEVETLIKDKNFEKAQTALDNIAFRNAEWHFLQASLFYQKMWLNDARVQLRKAIEKDPINEKYKHALTALETKLKNPHMGRGFYGGEGNGQDGNRTYRNTILDDENPLARGGCSICDCCAAFMCLDCMCNGGNRCC